MSKLSINKSKLNKVKMNYSKVIDLSQFQWLLVTSTWPVLRIKGGQGQNDQLFEGLLVSVKSIEKVTSTQEQVQEYCNWRKEALFRL